MSHIENEILHGSPISPILAPFYTAKLLEKFKPKPTIRPSNNTDKATEVHLFMYVDDGKLYVLSKSLKTNVERLKEAYNKAEEWLKTVGLSSDNTKRELSHQPCENNEPTQNSQTNVLLTWKDQPIPNSTLATNQHQFQQTSHHKCVQTRDKGWRRKVQAHWWPQRKSVPTTSVIEHFSFRRFLNPGNLWKPQKTRKHGDWETHVPFSGNLMGG